MRTPRIPLLLISDDPRKGTGLGRITHELAMQMIEDKEFSRYWQVGVVGVFGHYFTLDPYPIYPMKGRIDDSFRHLGIVWKDFAGGGRGVVMPICSPNWLWELVQAGMAARERQDWWPVVRMWERRPWKLWSYAAVEGEFMGRFNRYVVETMKGCDRVLMYSQWGMRLAQESGLDMKKVDWCHHGINTQTFRRIPSLSPNPSKWVIGCVMTNNPRKQHSLLAETAYHLKNLWGKDRFLIHLHTNALVDAWDIPLLLNDYGVTDEVTVSLDRWNDETVAKFYNQCHATFLPTSGEGFGFPVLESACCGTPCVTGSYGAQAELPCATVDPIHLLPQGLNNDMFPVYDAKHLARALVEVCEGQRGVDLSGAGEWSWEKQWPKFKKWFMKGIGEV